MVLVVPGDLPRSISFLVIPGDSWLVPGAWSQWFPVGSLQLFWGFHRIF